jgi:hypothetical protein
MSAFIGFDTNTLLLQTQRLTAIEEEDGNNKETGDEFIVNSNFKRGDTIEKSANSAGIIIDNPDNILYTNRRINIRGGGTTQYREKLNRKNGVYF